MAEVAFVDEFGIVRHEMQTIAIDLFSICLSVMWLRCANMAEWSEVLFGVETWGPKGHCIGQEFLFPSQI